MFRLYDTRRRELAEIRPARRGLLRVHLENPALTRPARIGDLRSYLLADLIRRNAERHRSSVIVCEDAAETGGLPAADCNALSLATPDFDCAAPSALGATDVVDVAVGEAGAHEDVRCWVLGEPVLFDGQDMPALADVSARGLDPLAVRLAFLGRGYRDQLDLSWDLLADADAEARRWRELVATWANEPSRPVSASYWSRFTEALDDDLDTPAALGALRDLAADSEPAGSKFETFAAGDRVLGLELVSLIGKLPA
jgi:cysteinyl-tRNA synthetase